MDYMVDPTYCLTKNGSHYFYDQDCVEEASNHTTCIANVYRNGLYTAGKIISQFQRVYRATFCI